MPTPNTQPSFYDTPAIYDILHTPGTAADVRGLERIARLHAAPPRGRSRTWLEPACGTGRHLRLLAAHGHRVIGTDRSEPAIAYARKRICRAGHADRACLGVGAMADPLPSATSKADVAFNTINSIRHLPSDKAMLAHLRVIARALTRNGLYAVGLSTTAYGLEPPSEDVWTAARGRCRVTQIVQYLPPKDRARTEHVISHLTINRPTGEQHVTDRYALRTYSLRQWLELIERSPFYLHAVTDEFGTELDPAECGYRIYLLKPG